MTDDSKLTGDDGAIRPQVIDLDAQDVSAEPEPTPPPPPSPPPNPARRSQRTGTYLALALILGLAAGAWIYRDLLSSYLPSSAMTEMQARIATLDAANKTLSEQLLAVSAAAEDARKQAAALSLSVEDAETAAAARFTALSGKVDDLASLGSSVATLKTDLDRLRQTVTAGGGGAGTADSAALAAIGQRLDALEKDLASLKSAGGHATQDVAVLSQSLADLKAKIATGAAFQVEYDRVFRMVPAAAGLDTLGAHAAAGLPTAAGLAAELTAAIPTLPKPAEPADSDDSWLDSILGAVSGLITIRDIGEADWPRLAEKAAALAEAGDLAQAVALVDAAEGETPSAMFQWRDRAAARLKLEAALIDTEKAVLRQIAVLGTSP